MTNENIWPGLISIILGLILIIKREQIAKHNIEYNVFKLPRSENYRRWLEIVFIVGGICFIGIGVLFLSKELGF
jgi:cytochrome c biogenesis protein CcdA